MDISSRSFREKVYTLTKQIPRGKVMTYGQVAKLVGSPGAARADFGFLW
jgi:methylated-DNA-protein-cysteine methyltransferase-like protein